MSKQNDLGSIKNTITKLPDNDLWALFPFVRSQLKTRKLIRTANVTGERGEAEAIRIYNETKGLTNLTPVAENCKNIDATGRDGKSYSIKTICGRSVNTGVFSGLGEKSEAPAKSFDYLIITVLDVGLQVDQLLELTWDQFVKFAVWNKGMRGWGLTVNKRLLAEATVRYQAQRDRDGREWRKHLYT